MHKLLKLPAEDHKACQPSGVSAEMSAAVNSSSQDKFMLVVPAKHMFGWLSEHKEVLQKLLSDGQAAETLQMPSGTLE